jgi:hypothetical protein
MWAEPSAPKLFVIEGLKKSEKISYYFIFSVDKLLIPKGPF